MELQLLRFLEDSGLLRGRIPSLKRAQLWMRGEFRASVQHGIALVENPVHAVCLSVLARNKPKGYLGGVTVGRPQGLATLPDIFVGVIDLGGVWHWAGSETGCVVNLHAVGRDAPAPGYPTPSGWPVFFVFGDCHPYRERWVRAGTRVVDLCERVKREVCAAFWREAQKEFAEAAWAPHRLPWFLDHEEYVDIFSS